MAAQITLEECQDSIPNLKAYHESFQRNGLYVPRWGMGINTKEYL